MPTKRSPADNGKADTPPRRVRAPAPKQLKYGRPVVEAAVKMLEGLLMFVPAFSHGAERNELGIPIRLLSEVEHTWLVDDWYEFGLTNIPFQNLIMGLFGRALYARLVTAHVGIAGTRLVGYEMAKIQAVNEERARGGAEPIDHPLPLPQLAAVANGAYMARLALQSQLDVIEQMMDEQDAVESGGARPGGGQDGEWENEPLTLPPQTQGARPDARHQG